MQETQETQVQSLDWEKEMATYSSLLAWKISQTEKPGKLQSIGSQRVGYNRVTDHTHTREKLRTIVGITKPKQNVLRI